MRKPAKPPAKPPVPPKGLVQAACDDAAMRAKRAILAQLDQYMADKGLSYKATVQAFVEAVGATAQSKLGKSNPQHVQIEGFGLPYSIIRDAKGRNEKRGSWRISARTLYSWKKLVRGDSAPSTTPRVKLAKSQTDKFNDACRFMKSAPDYMLDLLVEFYGAQLADALRRSGWVMQIEHVQRQS